MLLKLIFICGLTILATACRETRSEVDAEISPEQQDEELSEIAVTDLPQLLKSGMKIEEVTELLNRVKVKQHDLKKDDSMRIYFLPEQEKSGDLVRLDLQLSDDLVTRWQVGYRR